MTFSNTETVAEVIVTMNDHEKNKARHYPNNFVKTAKYNAITFLPLNLFFQFRRVSNFYFLINMIFALIPGVAPISPYTAVLPLVFVVGVALIKDGYEDYLRHLADSRANSITAHVVRRQADGKYKLVDVPSADVEVGDIIKIMLGEEIRADVLLLSSSLTESQGFIDTCNLDGETNLKNRKGVEATWQLNTVEALVDSHLELKTGAPDPGLLHWNGMISVRGHDTAVGLDQFLYRSAVLRNTDWIWGMVVYAGVDTKMFRNLQEKPPKMSSLDEKLNKLILSVLIFQVSFLIILASLGLAWAGNNKSHWYALQYITKQSGIELWIYRFLSYFILLSYMIPISLFVTIELCKVAQAKLMSYDSGMFEYMNGKWNGCIPNTSNLNEQLSQVRFIFSDKTGTLTENVMTYKLGNIHGMPITSGDWETSKGYLRQGGDVAKNADAYFKALALCHTIQPFDDPHNSGSLIYEGASPDEVALVRCAVEHGYVLLERTTRSMTLKINEKVIKFEILATLEFTPDRKMMSIIVQDPQGRITLFTKGADSFVIPQMQGKADAVGMRGTSDALREMALLGLRTLLVCTKELTQHEFQQWHAQFIEAGKTLGSNRSAVVDRVCLEMEKEMLLVGATAIEDKLQDQVPETLRYFLQAGVIVWMLTGDKRETAVTIAATSSLANPQTDYVDHIDIGELPMNSDEAAKVVLEQLQRVEQHINAKDKKVTFVIDGPALNVAMKHNFDFFLDLSQRVSSAVCCRLTPLQKANVVRMFQQATGATALAIGDGANDVSMIQEGKVGVGIVGLEGAQAALAADYAIPRFKHLRRLCGVHGRYALVRNAICILTSFYKNILLSLTQFYFAFFTGFSAHSLYDGWLLSFYNIFFTSLPPLIMGIFEKDIDEQTLDEKPELFLALGKGAYFDVPIILRWFGEGILHSILFFFITYSSNVRLDHFQTNTDGLMFGTMLITALVLTALGKMALHVRYWTWVEAAVFIISILSYFGFAIIYSAIKDLFNNSSFYFTFYMLMSGPKFWLYILLFAVGLLIPVDMTIMFMQKQLAPTPRDIAEEEVSHRSR
jgi:phospholipid-transporting ATPase